MKWIDFVVCLFFGIFGIHKFREQKIGLGILYIFTVGLLGFGWLYDSIRYLIRAISAKPINSIPPLDEPVSPVYEQKELYFDSPPLNNTKRSIGKTALCWIATVILAIVSIGSMPSLSSFFALGTIALILPIPKWKLLLNKALKINIRRMSAGILAVVTIVTLPFSTSPTSNITPDLSPDSITEPITITHTHTFTEATCTTPKTCSECGETEGAALGHQWLDATCVSPLTCATCNATEGTLGDHVWEEATCQTLRTCSECKLTEGEYADHSWIEATCTSPKTCSVCDLTEGDVIAHLWEDATCIAPMTCSVCNATEGDVSSHSWQEATCQQPKTCSVCKATEGLTAEHKYQNNVCIYCERNEPTVWIPNSGSRYHSRASCSNMNNPTEVPISTAISRGYTPCGRCY